MEKIELVSYISQLYNNKQRSVEIASMNISASAIPGLCGVSPYTKNKDGTIKSDETIQEETFDQILRKYNPEKWLEARGNFTKAEIKLYSEVNEFLKKDSDEYCNFILKSNYENPCNILVSQENIHTIIPPNNPAPQITITESPPSYESLENHTLPTTLTESTNTENININPDSDISYYSKNAYYTMKDFIGKDACSMEDKNNTKKIVMDKYNSMLKVVIEKFGDNRITKMVYDLYKYDYEMIPSKLRGNVMELKVISSRNLIAGNDKTLYGYYQLLGKYYTDVEDLKSNGNGMPYLCLRGKYDAHTQDGKTVEIKNTYGTGVPQNAVLQLAVYAKLENNNIGGLVIRKNTDGKEFAEEFSHEILELIFKYICSKLDSLFMTKFMLLSN